VETVVHKAAIFLPGCSDGHFFFPFFLAMPGDFL
jgi:hypothetical protein